MFPIVTHSGYFHLDEVMAAAMVDLLGLWNGTVIRTRDRSVITENIGKAIIIDVGGIYDPENLQFDHHQATFDEYFDSQAKGLGIKMSSCGLVYLHLGAELFGSERSDLVSELHTKFYKFYIQEIDANDNGVSELKDEYTSQVFRYTRRWNLNAVIGNWNGLLVADSGPLAEEQDRRFYEALSFCKSLLKRTLEKFVAQEKSYALTKEIFDRAELHTHQGNIVLVLDEKCDYYETTRELKYGNSEWVFTVIPRESGKNDPTRDQWQIRTVGVSGKKFQNKMDILKAEDAKELIGDDLIFVHNNRFIAATRNKESAILLAKKSIDEVCLLRRKESLDKWRKILGVGAVLCGILLNVLFRFGLPESF